MTTPVKVTQLAQLTGHNAAIFALADAPTAGRFLSAAGDGWIAEWALANPETGRLIARTERQIFSLLTLTDQRLVAGTLDGGLHWIDLQDTQRNRDVAHHQKGVFSLCATPNFVYSAGGGGMLTRWDPHTRRARESIRLSNQSLRTIAYHAGRQELAIGASDHTIYLLDESSLTICHTIAQAHTNSVFTLCYNQAGDRLYSGGRDAHLRVWALTDRVEIVSAQAAHLATLNAVVLHPSGQWLATASRDKTVKLWEADTGRLRKVLDVIRDGGHRNSVNTLRWSADGSTLITAGDDRTIILWDTSALPVKA